MDKSIEKRQDVNKEVDVNVIMSALEKGADISLIEKLIDLKMKVDQQKAEVEIRKAIANFQGEMPIVAKTKVVHNRDGSLRYKYAPIDEIVKISAPILAKHGLSVTIDTQFNEHNVVVTAIVQHIHGGERKSSFIIPIMKSDYMNDAQAVASALTYAKRYAYCNVLGIMTGDEDDDAQAVSKEEVQEVKQEVKRDKKKGNVIQLINMIEKAETLEILEGIAEDARQLAWTPGEIKTLKAAFDLKRSELGGAK